MNVILVLWIENIFSRGSVFVILYMAFGVVIEELCPSPLLFLCVVPFGMYLDYDEDIDILVGLASCFVNQNLMVL